MGSIDLGTARTCWFCDAPLEKHGKNLHILKNGLSCYLCNHCYEGEIENPELAV